MKSKWNEVSEDQCYHTLHFTKGMSKRYDDFCHDLTDSAFDNLSQEDKDRLLKNYIFMEAREGCPKNAFLFAEQNDMKHLIEKYNFVPEEFSN